VTDLFQGSDEATPLAPEERDGLRQTWITHRRDLNEAEEENILKGAAWAGRRRLSSDRILTDDFVRELHRRMFGDVWRWAGAYRATERNIGMESYRISVEVASLIGDARYWIAHQTYPPDEIAIRVHHRLVAIHPFPNGNGRHARQIADLLLADLGGKPLSWGGGSLKDAGELRVRYIAALRSADAHDIGPLLEFARS
jgi:Fic-DOC domain mobile mystery protein B